MDARPPRKNIAPKNAGISRWNRRNPEISAPCNGVTPLPTTEEGSPV